LKIDGLLLVDLFSFVDNFEEKLGKNVSESKNKIDYIREFSLPAMARVVATGHNDNGFLG